MTNLELFCTEETTKVLVELGIPANLQGFRCLQSAIVKVVLNPDLIKKITKFLYPQVGNEQGVSGPIAERSIRHSTDIGYSKTGFKSLNKIFGLDCKPLVSKPTNCELIAIISEAIRFKARRQNLID